jgi:hypothetical protein
MAAPWHGINGSAMAKMALSQLMALLISARWHVSMAAGENNGGVAGSQYHLMAYQTIISI